MSRFKSLIQPALLRLLLVLVSAFSLPAPHATAQGQVISGVVMRVTAGAWMPLNASNAAGRLRPMRCAI
jgi:hypothetical protein